MAELVTASELSSSDIFGGKISTDKLYRLAKKKAIPAVQLDGRVYFPINVIREWIKETSKVDTSSKVLSKYGHIKAIPE